jgi:hypothetical protein
MSDLIPTYTFEGEEIFAIHEGRVIASGTKMAEVEKSAVDYLDSLKNERASAAKSEAKKKATHIITPNGLKGEILGRNPDVWGDQVTARFENGRIATFAVHGEEDVQWITEKTASFSDPTARLSAVIEESFEHDRESLAARVAALADVAIECHRLITAGASYPTEVKLDQIKIAAEAESRQVKEALDHLDSADAEAFRAPEFTPRVAEQADMGTGAGNSWLDVTTQEMIEESEAIDHDKLLQEGPSMFVTDLETGALADTGVTRELAVAHVVSKTAGFVGEEIEDYREKFVARVEVARRHELASRKETTKKEAATRTEVESNAPDEALFM